MSVLDWLVIAGYFVGMLAVGQYYARRNRTTDDYLLGGRRMSPFAIGLSLFATLTSRALLPRGARGDHQTRTDAARAVCGVSVDRHRRWMGTNPVHHAEKSDERL